MGCTASARICLGIPFEEGFEFPWGNDSIEDWYHKSLDPFVSKTPYPYNEEGNYLSGKTDVDGTAYYKELSAWKKANPVPFDVEEVKCGSDEYYTIALVVKSKTMYHDWEDISTLNVEALSSDVSKDKQDLIDFCNKYGIKTDKEPTWIVLCRYW